MKRRNPPSESKSVTVRPRRPREYLTEPEINRLMAIARRDNRWGHRDSTAIWICYRQGLRCSELCDLEWDQIDLSRKTIIIRRVKNGDPGTHYLSNTSCERYGD
jgi:integrase